MSYCQTGNDRVVRAQSKRRLNARKTILGAPNKPLPNARAGVSGGIVAIVGDRSLFLRNRGRPLPFVEKDSTLHPMGLRILRLKGQCAVDRFLGTRQVTRRVLAPKVV